MKKILFIEDESALQKTFGDFLGSRGYEIIAALDGITGLELAKKTKPDMILLDLILPKMHGLEVLRQLREVDETKTTPVIILTNLEGINDVEKALELGAMTYLVKAQYTLEELFEKIKKAIGD